MKVPLHIIVDVSGSMNEMGKIHLQRNLCRYAAQVRLINQEKYLGSDIRFYQWAKNVSEFSLQSNGDIPALNAGGSSKLCDLSDFLSRHLNNPGRAMILILSDGNFSNTEIVSFQSQRNTFDLIIRTVAVGADSNLLKLKKISTNNTVYLSENIATAIDNIIFGSDDESLTAPVSITQILESAPIETEASEEDWDV